MSYVDIGIIAFVVLFAALGVWKGVQKSALVLGAFLVSFIVAYFLAGVVAEAFLGIDSIKEFVMGEKGFSLYTWINNSMGSTPWEGKTFIAENFYKPIYDIVIKSKELSAAFTVQDGVALSAAFSVFSAIIGIGLFLVVRLLLCIVTMIVKMYIPKSKSVKNRVGGLFVGMARGAVWSFIFTIVFTAIGGFGFVSFIDTMEDNYEDSVFAKHLNVAAYGLKNATFIPGQDQFTRLVIKGGFNNKGEKPEQKPDALKKEKNELYADIMNLNYPNGSRWTVDSEGKLVENIDVVAINPAAYRASGFENVIRAIVDYNNNVGARILAEDGPLANATIETINECEDVYTGIWAVMYGVNNPYTSLSNYMEKVTAPDFNEYENPDFVADLNSEIEEYYTAITRAFDAIATEYSKLTVFTADEQLGALRLPNYPNMIRAKVKPTAEQIALRSLYADIANLNFVGNRYSVVDNEIVQDQSVQSLNTADYTVTAFDVLLDQIVEYNNKITDRLIPDEGVGVIDDASLTVINSYIAASSDIAAKLQAVYSQLDAYKALITDEEFGNRVDQEAVDAANEQLEQGYNAVVEALNELRAEYAKLTRLTADPQIGELDLTVLPEIVQDEVSESEEEGGEDEGGVDDGGEDEGGEDAGGAGSEEEI